MKFTAKENQALKMVLLVEISDVNELMKESLDKDDKKELLEYLSLVKTIYSNIISEIVG